MPSLAPTLIAQANPASAIVAQDVACRWALNRTGCPFAPLESVLIYELRQAGRMVELIAAADDQDAIDQAGAALAWAWYGVLQRWQAQPSAALDQAPETQHSAVAVADALRDAVGAPLIDGAIGCLPGGELVELAPLRLLDLETGAPHELERTRRAGRIPGALDRLDPHVDGSGWSSCTPSDLCAGDLVLVKRPEVEQ